jgi:hypothetical protein
MYILLRISVLLAGVGVIEAVCMPVMAHFFSTCMDQSALLTYYLTDTRVIH